MDTFPSIFGIHKLEQFRIIDGTSILQLWSNDVKKYAEIMGYRTNLFNQAYPQIIGYQGFGQKLFSTQDVVGAFRIFWIFGPVFGSNGNIPLPKARTLPAHHRVRLQRPLVSSHAWGFCHQRDAARLHRPAAITQKENNPVPEENPAPI